MDISGCDVAIMILVGVLAFTWILFTWLWISTRPALPKCSDPYQDEEPSARRMVVTVKAGRNIPAESPVVIGNDGMVYTPGQVPNHGTYRIIGIATSKASEGDTVKVRLI